jgi:hypothetical protein
MEERRLFLKRVWSLYNCPIEDRTSTKLQIWRPYGSYQDLEGSPGKGKQGCGEWSVNHDQPFRMCRIPTRVYSDVCLSFACGGQK